MLLSLIQEGATIILPREENEEDSLESSFKKSLLKRRKVLPINTSIIPSPVPG